MLSYGVPLLNEQDEDLRFAHQFKADGDTRAALEGCSCSIDVIAWIVPYERCETAETFGSLGFVTGERGALFRESAAAKSADTEPRRAQAEADVRCF